MVTKCLDCGKEFAANRSHCPQCGAKNPMADWFKAVATTHQYPGTRDVCWAVEKASGTASQLINGRLQWKRSGGFHSWQQATTIARHQNSRRRL